MGHIQPASVCGGVVLVKPVALAVVGVRGRAAVAGQGIIGGQDVGGSVGQEGGQCQ